MRKNGSRLISLRQYRLTDLFLFAGILIAFDLLAHFTPRLFGSAAFFTFTLTVPIVLMVMIRWGWPCVLFAVGDGLFMSALNNTYSWQSYLCYSLGFAAITLLLIPLKFIGKQKITGKWYFSVLFVVCAWLIMNFALTCFEAICGNDFAGMLVFNIGLNATGMLSLAIGIVVILVVRRLDGMFEDQKHYLIRKDNERKELARRDEFGDEPIDIDEETLSILRKHDDDLY